MESKRFRKEKYNSVRLREGAEFQQSLTTNGFVLVYVSDNVSHLS